MGRTDDSSNDDGLADALDRALGTPLAPAERRAALEFVRTELPAFQVSGRTTYLVLGSYRDGFERRLRLVQRDLNERTDTFAAVVGDFRDPEFDERSPFAVKLHLTATYADWLVGVYEKESGGEGPELGVVHGHYFEKTHVLPRDYAWMTGENVDSQEAARKTALEIYFNEDLDDEEKRAELEGLLATVRDESVDVTREELVETIREREAAGREPATYSWVHASFFRDFERAGQCYPWFTEAELRERTDDVPGPARPEWDAERTPDD